MEKEIPPAVELFVTCFETFLRLVTCVSLDAFSFRLRMSGSLRLYSPVQPSRGYKAGSSLLHNRCKCSLHWAAARSFFTSPRKEEVRAFFAVFPDHILRGPSDVPVHCNLVGAAWAIVPPGRVHRIEHRYTGAGCFREQNIVPAFGKNADIAFPISPHIRNHHAALLPQKAHRLAPVLGITDGKTEALRQRTGIEIHIRSETLPCAAGLGESRAFFRWERNTKHILNQH